MLERVSSNQGWNFVIIPTTLGSERHFSIFRNLLPNLSVSVFFFPNFKTIGIGFSISKILVHLQNLSLKPILKHQLFQSVPHFKESEFSNLKNRLFLKFVTHPERKYVDTPESRN